MAKGNPDHDTRDVILPPRLAKKLKSSYLVATGATLAAAALFVRVGSDVVPPFLARSGNDYTQQGLGLVLLLNIALILFAWRRSKDLKAAIEAHSRAERRAHAAAFSDHVTGLPNRRELIRRIEEVARDKNPSGTLLLLDLDHFKTVNDLYGHAVGDRLLCFVAEALQSCVPAASCAVRLGGDEFAVLLPPHYGSDDASRIAERLLDQLAEPITLEETTAQISASLGIARLDGRITTTDNLLRHADIAMYRAKREGRNCFLWFDPQMEQDLRRRSEIEAEMRIGIARGEFVPYYQPLIDLAKGEVKGFEVLARWHHPEQGVVPPDSFIGIAETCALISDLSLSVMRQALSEAKDWPSYLTIAVNVSPVQFRDPLLAQRFLQLMTETGFPPQRLEIEVTESALFEDQTLALATVESLKNNGVKISLDDFGTGYASLTQLKSLPFDRIKIDRSFVSALLDDAQSTAIVETIARLGISLQVPITAEGVETEAVRQQLELIGCSEAQGWLFGKAVPSSDIRELLRTLPVRIIAKSDAGADGIRQEASAPSAPRKKAAPPRARKASR